ncbi:hypothetical protein [Campylobacter gastrosuis]|uniref:Uncharacterized protein n=1 Tax=Campylobacter gastrosuis TaxID=2974576 RepID=A0ABT7HNU4_9BACT|nr:hypothetical protein [Campylobacter gastrosuis]MDL0088573.1 hypothetical protein [Campylobacter gastrosuis]
MNKLDFGEQFAFSLFTGILSGVTITIFNGTLNCVTLVLLFLSVAFLSAIYFVKGRKNEN